MLIVTRWCWSWHVDVDRDTLMLIVTRWCWSWHVDANRDTLMLIVTSWCWSWHVDRNTYKFINRDTLMSIVDARIHLSWQVDFNRDTLIVVRWWVYRLLMSMMDTSTRRETHSSRWYNSHTTKVTIASRGIKPATTTGNIHCYNKIHSQQQNPLERKYRRKE